MSSLWLLLIRHRRNGQMADDACANERKRRIKEAEDELQAARADPMKERMRDNWLLVQEHMLMERFRGEKKNVKEMKKVFILRTERFMTPDFIFSRKKNLITTPSKLLLGSLHYVSGFLYPKSYAYWTFSLFFLDKCFVKIFFSRCFFLPKLEIQFTILILGGPMLIVFNRFM